MSDDIGSSSSHANLAHLLAPHASNANTALVINDTAWSYAEFTKYVRKTASYLKHNQIKILGILASRSLEAYAGVIAAHWHGVAYVPLNPALPVIRLHEIMQSSGIDALMVDDATLMLAEKLDPSLRKVTLGIIAAEPEYLTPALTQSNDLAYLIYTSGSTGKPKGVPVSFGNLNAFIQAIKHRYQLSKDDRISQFSELSFDVSIFDMILAIGSGAALYVVPEETRLAPATFIQENRLTVWLGVPSTISIMQKIKLLQAGKFPFLKYSIFTGEALTISQAKLWHDAAPNSQLENLYGPTEATIDCLGYVLNDLNQQTNFVPIGKPFPHVHAALVNEAHEFLPVGEEGELVIAGSQVVSGYWHAPEQTSQKFVILTHPIFGGQIWYLTGDYCHQDKNGDFHYLGRLDNQCKILGQRIELEEIEYHLRKFTHLNEVAAVFIPTKSKIIAVVTDPDQDLTLIHEQLKQWLPDYMLPDKVIYMNNIPYTTNLKLDRRLLAEQVTQVLSHGNS